VKSAPGDKNAWTTAWAWLIEGDQIRYWPDPAHGAVQWHTLSSGVAWDESASTRALPKHNLRNSSLWC